jgi:DNA-3-methyladenine glycosylase II
LLKLRPARLRTLGLSRQKIEYIRDLARHTRNGKVDFARLAACSDTEVIEHLTAVKGIGVWTVHMFLIFALRRENVLPTGDLGIRVAIRKAYGLADLPKPAEMESIARNWHPYCSVASWYLWRSLETNAGL